MPRPLPLNIQVEILGHLSGYSGYGVTTLVPCCSVCKVWRRICQRKLFKTVFISNHQQLKRLVASLSSATHPIGNYVTPLDLYDDLCRVAPFYLATKLPLLQRLNIEWTNVTPFNVQSSLIMSLKHFRAVIELTLNDLTFQSFWDFYRFIVALPALSNLHLDGICLYPNLSQRSDGKVPSVFMFPQNLTQLYVHTLSKRFNPLPLNPLWIWSTPFQARHQKPTTNSHSCPFLTRHDADIIWEFVEFVGQWHDESVFGNLRTKIHSKFEWSFDEDRRQCEYTVLVYCRDLCSLTAS